MENSANLTAYCGLYCGECLMYKNKVADLARDLRKELRESKFDKIAPALSGFMKELKDYPICYAVLGAMVKLRCRKSCYDGGGHPCKVRDCCTKKGFRGCWECDIFDTCTKLNFLRQVHGDAHIKNMKIISKKGMDGFLKGVKYW
jgi:hypothetical protein